MRARLLSWLSRCLPGGDVGRRGEKAAAAYLRRQGLRILDRNVRAGRGEIDLVALDGETLVFVEVKSRTGAASDERTGLEKIDRRKRRALRRAGAVYRKKHGDLIEHYRLDAVTVAFDPGAGRQRVREVRWYRAWLDLDEESR